MAWGTAKFKNEVVMLAMYQKLWQLSKRREVRCGGLRKDRCVKPRPCWEVQVKGFARWGLRWSILRMSMWWKSSMIWNYTLFGQWGSSGEGYKWLKRIVMGVRFVIQLTEVWWNMFEVTLKLTKHTWRIGRGNVNVESPRQASREVNAEVFTCARDGWGI